MMPRLRRFLIIQGVIIFFALLPLLSAFGAEWIANLNGCELHEGYTNPCIVFGQDIGGHLSTAFVAGWFMLISLPLGFMVWLGHIIFEIFSYVKARNRLNK